jgi:hypothetical protein
VIIERCRTAALSGHVARCEAHTRSSPTTDCCNRHRPKGQGTTAARLVPAWQRGAKVKLSIDTTSARASSTLAARSQPALACSACCHDGQRIGPCFGPVLVVFGFGSHGSVIAEQCLANCGPARHARLRRLAEV